MNISVHTSDEVKMLPKKKISEEYEENSDDIEVSCELINNSSNDNKSEELSETPSKVIIEKKTVIKKSKTESFAEKLQKCASIVVQQILDDNIDKRVINEVLCTLHKRHISKEKRNLDIVLIRVSLMAAWYIKKMDGSPVAMEATVISILSCCGSKKYEHMSYGKDNISAIAYKAAKIAMLKDMLEDKENSIAGASNVSNNMLELGYSKDAGASFVSNSVLEEYPIDGRVLSGFVSIQSRVQSLFSCTEMNDD